MLLEGIKDNNFLLVLFYFSAPLCSSPKVKLGGKDCTYKGSSVCNGAVTKMIGSKYLQICTEGKLKLKKTEVVAKGYPLVGTDTGPGKGKGDRMFSQTGQTGQNRI